MDDWEAFVPFSSRCPIGPVGWSVRLAVDLLTDSFCQSEPIRASAVPHRLVKRPAIGESRERSISRRH